MAPLNFLTALLVVDALAVLLHLLLLGILHLPVRMQIPPFALPVYLYLVIRGWCWILRRTNFVYLNCKIFFSRTLRRRRLLVHWSGWNCGGNDDGFNGAEDEDQMTILSSIGIYDEFDHGPVLSICLGQWYHSPATCSGRLWGF